MTAETVANALPFAGMLALLALFGVLALVDWWRVWRRRSAVLRDVAALHRLANELRRLRREDSR